MKKSQPNQIGRQFSGGLSVAVKTLVAVLTLAAVSPSQAANETWTGGNTPDFNWNTNANWSAAIPVIDDQIFFDGVVGLLNTNNISANTEFSGLTFKNTAGAFTLIGNAITLANGGGITNNSASIQTNRLTSALAVTNSGIVNYVTTPGGGKIVFINQLNWANAAVTNSRLNFINASAVATGQFGTGGNNNSISNVLACYGSLIDGANGRLNTANGISDTVILDNTIATNFGGMVVGNGGTSFNTTVIITNGSKLYITGSDLFEVNRNTGAQGNKVIVTGPGSAWINRGTHAFALGGSSGNCTNAMVEVSNGAIWDLGGSTFRLNYNGPQNSIYANNGTLTNVYSLIIGNGSFSNSMTLANGSKFNFSGASGDFRELGRGNNAFNNTLTITDPNTFWDSGGATFSIGTASGTANYSNIMTIANGAVFTNGSLTVGGQGTFQTLIISNAKAYINTMVVNGNNSIVYLNGGSSDTVYFGTLGNNATGILTNTANTSENLVLGWNNASQTANPVPVMGGLMNIIKTGTGSQNLQNANVFVGNILVTGGTLGSGTQQTAADGSFSAFGVLTTPGKTITITNGGTLNLGNAYALLNGLTPDTLPPITVYPGSTLNSSRFNAIGQLTLTGGTLLQNSSDASPLNGYQFFTNVTVSGSAASTVSGGANGLPNDLYNAANGGTTFNVANTASGGADLTVSAGLADFSNDGVTALAGSLIKTGAGVMVSTGTNTYTGLTTVMNGELGFSSYSPQSGGIAVNDGAILDVTVSGTSQMVPSALTLGSSGGATLQFVNLASTTTAPVIATSLTLNGTVTLNLKFPSVANGNQYPLITYTTIGGSGHLTLGAGGHGTSMNLVTNNNGDGTFTIALNVVSTSAATTDVWTGVNSGNWDFATANWTVGGGSANYFDGDFVVFTNGTSRTNVTIGTTVTPGSVTVNSASNYVFTSSGGGHIAGTGNLTKSGSGSLALAGLANTYVGTNTISGGTVIIDSGANLGVVANPVILAGGALSASTTVTLNVNRPLILGVGTLDVASGQTLNIPGVLVDNLPGTGSLTKTGAGTLNLTGTNTYTGSTLVNGGKLIITTAQQGGGAITVGDTSALTVVASGGAILPTASLTLGTSGSTTLTLQGVSGTNAAILATNLIANGSVTLSVIGGATKLGEIPLIKYSTFSSGSIANFALASTLPPNVSAVLTNDTSGKFIGLLITAINGLKWAGTNGPNWDIATTANWLYGASGSVFSDGSAVLFDNTGVKDVTISQLVSPAGMVVNNSSIIYTFTPANGSAGIGGPGGFLKLGAGTMNYASVTNGYAGPTVIGGGQVTLGAHPALSQTAPGSQLLEFSTNTVAITNNAFLQLAGVGGSATVWHQTMSNSITLDGGSVFAQDGGQHLAGPISIGNNGAAFGDQQINKFLYLDGPISGTGAISVPLFGGINDGIHTPGGSGYGGPNFTYSANPYSGTITLYNGYIGIQDADGTCLANATLDLEGYNATFGAPVVWTANFTHAITLAGLAGANSAMLLNLTEPSDGWYVSLTVGNNTVGTATYRGALNDTSGAAGVTKVGSNAQWLVGTNTYPGVTMVNNGELGISTAHAGNGSFNVSDGASLGVTNMGGAISAQMSSLTLGSSGATTLEFQNVADITTPVVNCGGGLTANGTSTIKITGTNGLVAGNTYPLVKYGSVSGGFLLALPANVSATLTNDTGNSWIALNVTAVGSPVNTSPTTITNSVSGGNLTLSWPPDHTGWRLQVQTNTLSVGLYTNWVTVANSTTTNSVTIPISSANGAVFYRLVYP